MKTLRKHSWLIVGVALSVTLVATFIWRNHDGGSAMAQAQDAPPPMTQDEHDAVRSMLSELGLTRGALIALNPTNVQAESVLSNLRGWWETNQNTLATLAVAIHANTYAVRQLQGDIAMGPYDSADAPALALARQELAAAQAAYDSALTPARAEVNAILSESQEATWSACQSGFGNAMPIAMLNLTDAQRVSLSRAMRTFARQRAAARTQEAHEAAAAAYDSALASLLTIDQETVIGSYASYYNDASESVALAFDSEMAVSDG